MIDDNRCLVKPNQPLPILEGPVPIKETEFKAVSHQFSVKPGLRVGFVFLIPAARKVRQTVIGEMVLPSSVRPYLLKNLIFMLLLFARTASPRAILNIYVKDNGGEGRWIKATLQCPLRNEVHGTGLQAGEGFNRLVVQLKKKAVTSVPRHV
ncbi:hypothetical protein N657DRAFT_649919 [Parathielavia appendiculata]|uniref:Uncharacterized protein n=1 Tax=Parathielavia appendiculata TaxID=2587402 RepID=A0AAN6TT56_9PEZI|nr:hypothetical protein N657DRAFT_649919 [Parathielavia appendiculata]